MRPPGVETYAGLVPAGVGPARVPVKLVLSVVAGYFSVETEALSGPGRTANLALARHVAAYFLRTRCALSFPEIAVLLGRDHTAVMYGVARVARDLEEAEGIIARLKARNVAAAVRDAEAALDVPLPAPAARLVGHAETDANWPSFRARLEGRCTSCDGLISPGQSICKSRSGWEHDPGRKGDGCPADPPEEAGVGDG